MVESDWLDLVREDVGQYLTETFLAHAPVVEVSSSTGEGLEELIRVIDELVGKVPERDMGHIFRLPVDRVFTMKGFGTVITGTRSPEESEPAMKSPFIPNRSSQKSGAYRSTTARSMR